MDSLRDRIKGLIDSSCEEDIDGLLQEISDVVGDSCDIIDKIEEAVIEANAFLGELNKLDYIDCDELVVKMKEVEKSLY